MSFKKPEKITDLKHELELLHALNTAAAAMQQVTTSEEELFSAFGNELKLLNLHGSLHILNDAGDRLTIQAATPSNRMLGYLESLTGTKVVGHQIDLSTVHSYRKMLEEGAPRFVPDNTDILRELVPAAFSSFVKHVLKTFGGMPGIFAPFRIGGQIGGLVSIVGDTITAADVPAVQAFSNHIGVALHNVRLSSALQQEIASRKTTEQALIRHKTRQKSPPANIIQDESPRSGEVKYQTLFETSIDAIFLVNTDGFIVDCNTAACTIHGYADKSEVIGLSVPDFVTDKNAADLPQMALAEKNLKIQVTARRKDGSLFPAEASVTAFALDGQPLLLVYARDITARKQAEADIQHHNRKLAILNQIIAASAMDMSTKELLETVCRQLAVALGLPRAFATLIQLDSQSCLVVAEYIEPPRASLVGQAIRLDDNPAFTHISVNQSPLVLDIPAQEPPSTDFHRIAQAQRIMRVLVVPVFVDNQMAGCIYLTAEHARSFSDEDIDLAWSVTDQTAGAVSRTMSNEKRRQLMTAVERLAESIIIVDAHGNITYTNPAFEQNTGYTQAEALGRHIRFLAAEANSDTGFQPTATPWRGRLAIQRKDGRVRTIDAAINPVFTAYGDLTNYALIYRDITDNLAREAQFYRAQRMEAVGQLAAGIAHDFNNLLTTINGFAELVHDQLDESAPQRSSLRHIINSGQRAARLVSQLLAFSRKQMINPRELNLNQVIRQAMPVIQQSVGNQVTVNTHLADDLWLIKMDPGQFEQILVQLALNARDAMPDGGQFIIETKNAILDKSYTETHPGSEPGAYVQLTVTDTGLGMSETVQKRIFEPFFTTKEVGQGSGLGLSSVYGSVKQNRGNIWAYSEEGQGTTFKIYLPRLDIAPADNALPMTMTEIPTGTETILLAEDDEHVRHLVVWVLEGQGYTIIPAANGTEALRTATDHTGPIDLLISDVMMEGLNGVQLRAELEKTRPTLKTLFMSGYSEAALVPHGVSVNRHEFLPKPFSPVELAQKVRMILDA